MANAATSTWKGKKRPNPIKRGKRGTATLWNDAQRDPEMLFLIEKAENDSRSNNAMAREAYLAPGTVANIVDGVTRRPTNATITFLAKALGYRRAFVQDDTGKTKYVPLWQDRIDQMQAKIDEKAAAAKKNGKGS